ncbi:VanZ like protein [Motilibacter peucedani]|uniref:VanZ like protein n=1 Tax=Motilibacter peucedani TaxID=598650 RepID=A0A420XST2_9ACTN|nr:VanZ family protein [Motilibacter peucedani]RKS77936.1 VanZ like protein [Motilibacter peucedani]
MTDLRSRAAQRLATAALCAYLLVLAGAAFLPLPGPPVPGASHDAPSANLHLHRPDLLGGWETERNVLMTVPLGLLLPLVVRRRYEQLLLVCVAVPVAIETGQLLGSLAVGRAWRSFDVDDILNNTVGGVLGLAATGAALALTGTRRLPALLPAHRFVAGAAAAALLGWAAFATLVGASPADGDTCSHPATRPVTRLTNGVVAYAVAGGSLCVVTADGTSSVPADSEPTVLSYESDGDSVVSAVGVTRPDSGPAVAPDGSPVHPEPVDGSPLLVWATGR